MTKSFTGSVWRWIGLSLIILAGGGCSYGLMSHDPRVVTGVVTDERGNPVAGTPVLLVSRTLTLSQKSLGDFEERGPRQELRTVTDEAGRYRFEFVPAELGNNIFLVFYATEGFDAVRFEKPETPVSGFYGRGVVDVTMLLDRQREVVWNAVLRTHPDWDKVQKRLQEYGPSSDRGRILRQFGLPEKEEQVGDSEVWWYYSKGQSFRFVGGSLDSSFQFPPAAPRERR